MNKIAAVFIIFIFSLTGSAQVNQVWKGYYSYNSIKDITLNETGFIAASDNAYFKRDVTTNQSVTVTTVEGLSGQTISQIYHSETFKKTIVGHIDGFMTVVNETDGSMLNVVDIVNKVSVPSNKKRINHFTEFNGKLYISTDYGISVFDLQTMEFGDTYFIGPNGSNIEIFQTVVFNNTIYTVANGYGLLSASVTNPNLIDFNQWTMVAGGNWKAVEKTNTEIVLLDNGIGLHKLVGNNPVFVMNFNQIPADFRFVENKLVVTTQNYVYVLNNLLANLYTVNNTSDPATRLICATIKNDVLYIGTQEKGVVSTTQANTAVLTNATPPGAYRNKVFGVKTSSKGTWMAYGDYNAGFNPYPLDTFNISKYTETDGWKDFAYSTLLGTKTITSITVKPTDENEVFMSSYYSGLLKIKNEVPEIQYNASNSSLRSIPGQVPDDIRVGFSDFDRAGNLWMPTSLSNNLLHVFRSSGQWQSYNIACAPANTSLVTKGLVADKNNTKWIMTRVGLVAFNDGSNKCIMIKDGTGEGNLPSRDVRALAIDKNNRLWIGTLRGLRVLPSVDSFQNQDELETSSIIILEDGLAQELLYQQFITDIVVDGANNKWIATAGSGVFFVSPDGQKTFNIFTKENSPLPSNIVNDIDIDMITGEVFMATEAGMVSYKGNATSGAGDLKNVVVFPNPVRPNFTGNVSITGLMDKCNVKITDISGNLVYEEVAKGGTIMWDTRAFGKHKVASGVYVVHVSSEDGAEVETKKIMIVR
ncbi:T9SS type A sorting domain-containing protein [Flavobacterium amniphilum]|uniref:type IX secretion system anionic LPS delivery protein PorZ n=1 Tax=Flavobacterium amniphilum TaxID=1834035 RepID=UPI00202A46FD|nr:T9SS type A sorting domain-containing protein [Flavobacterium amniphilum]MCL9805965.1 T9SS type A sorting domain-containing protein [Flavobacterium amniphilum]